MTNQILKDKVQKLIQLGNRLYNNLYIEDNYSDGYVNNGDFAGFKTLCLSFIEKIYGKNHTYFKEFKTASNDTYKSNIDESLSILKSIEFEIENGWLNNLKKLVASELFSDFLEMSKYFLDEGYKDPAAVMIGSTLEEKLRQIYIENNIKVNIEKDGKISPKKANQLNNDIYKDNIYNSLVHKNVTSWLDLRNKAAHGKYNEYSKENVELMYQGVLNFLTTE